MNSTSAPFRTRPLTGPPPRPGRPTTRSRASARPISSTMRRASRSGAPWSAARLPPRLAGGRGRRARPAGACRARGPRRPAARARAPRPRRGRPRAAPAGRCGRHPRRASAARRRAHRSSIWPGRTTTPCFSSSRRAAASTWRSVIRLPSPRARNAAASAADLMPAPVRSSSRAEACPVELADQRLCPPRRSRPPGRAATAARARSRSAARSR